MRIGTRKNEYGTKVGVYICEECYNEFTVCPNPDPDNKNWPGCLAPQCTSYDPLRDMDLLFDDPAKFRAIHGEVPKLIKKEIE